MSATDEQLAWANYQNNTFIKSANVLIEVKTKSNQFVFFTNYDDTDTSHTYTYKIINNINCQASGSLIWSKLPSITVAIDLYTNDSSIINILKTLLEKNDYLAITYTYTSVANIHYMESYIIDDITYDSYNGKIRINATNYAIKTLSGTQYNGELKNDEGVYVNPTFPISTDYIINGIISKCFGSSISFFKNGWSNSNYKNGIVCNLVGLSCLEALQMLLTSLIGQNENAGGLKLPALMCFSYYQNTTISYEMCFSLENTELLTDISSTQVSYDNNKTDKYIVTPKIELDYPVITQDESIRNVVIMGHTVEGEYQEYLYEGYVTVRGGGFSTTVKLIYEKPDARRNSTYTTLEYDQSIVTNISNIEYGMGYLQITLTTSQSAGTSTISFKVKGYTPKYLTATKTNYVLDANGTKDIEIDNPLIATGVAEANSRFNCIKGLLATPIRTLEVKCRLDPSICLFSIIKVIDKLDKNYYVWVNEYNYIFNGGFTGTIKGLIVDAYDYFKIVEKPIYSGYLYSDINNFDLIFYNTNNFTVGLQLVSNSGSEISTMFRIEANSYLEITPENAPQNLLDMIDYGDFPFRVWFIELKDNDALTSDVFIVESDGE